MSWDACAFRVPAEFATVQSIPGDFQPPVLGDRSYVIEQIRQVVAGIDASDPSWIVIDGDGCSIEISLAEEQIDSLSFFCRGDGDAVIGILWAIARKLSLRVIDLQSSEFLEPGAEAEASFARWRAYRDQVVGDPA